MEALLASAILIVSLFMLMKFFLGGEIFGDVMAKLIYDVMKGLFFLPFRFFKFILRALKII